MTSQSHPKRIVRFLRRVALATAIVCLGALLAGATGVFALGRLQAYGDVPTDTLAEAVGIVGLDAVAEEPSFTPRHPSGRLPVCADLPRQSAKPIRLGIGLMRGTPEGRRLYDLLVEHEVCITVDDLAFNGAFARTVETFPGDWSESTIVIDGSIVRSSSSDLVAAVLVHEATHVDRAISGRDCARNGDCTRLPNGVYLDEEVAAHAAEAEWWIAAFGDDGKRFAFRTDYGENELAAAYRRGEFAFRDYVRDFRDDPRDGSPNR